MCMLVMRECFAEGRANLDENLHSWVLPDISEDGCFRVNSKSRYERVKLGLVKHYIRSAAKLN